MSYMKFFYELLDDKSHFSNQRSNLIKIPLFLIDSIIVYNKTEEKRVNRNTKKN